jgi:hypothetical protein
MGSHAMTMNPIGCAFRVAPDGQRAVKTLVAAAFALMCAACTEGLAAEASAD